MRFETHSCSLLTCSCPFGLGGLNCGNREYAEGARSAWAGPGWVVSEQGVCPLPAPQSRSPVPSAPVLGGVWKATCSAGTEGWWGDKHLPQWPGWVCDYSKLSVRCEAGREGPHPRRIASLLLGGGGLEVLGDSGRYGGRKRNNLKVSGQPGSWYSLGSL